MPALDKPAGVSNNLPLAKEGRHRSRDRGRVMKRQAPIAARRQLPCCLAVRSLRRVLASIAVAAVTATTSVAANACGYHLAIGGVSVVHPSSIGVAVAIHAAVGEGRLEPLAEAPAPLALVRANNAMRSFATALESNTADLPPIAFVLVEAHLWGRAVPGAGPASWQAHADGPASDDVIVVTGEPALAALLDGRLRWEAAIASGLVVVAGPAQARAQVVGILARQFS